MKHNNKQQPNLQRNDDCRGHSRLLFTLTPLPLQTRTTGWRGI